jgi:hypothetical protein
LTGTRLTIIGNGMIEAHGSMHSLPSSKRGRNNAGPARAKRSGRPSGAGRTALHPERSSTRRPRATG